MGRRYSLDPLADLVTGQVEQEEEELRERPELQLTPRRQEALDYWSKDPWTFLTAVDPDDGKTPIIRTVDQRDTKNPVKAYPAHLDYCHFMVDVLESEPYLLIEKCSQMIVSTTILLWSAWRCAFRDSWSVLLSKHTEDEANLLLKQKIEDPWGYMPDWVRLAIPCRRKPASRAHFYKRDSTVVGLPENAARGRARGQTYHTGLIDEAEYQEETESILSAMIPRGGQVILWSTPGIGRGAEIFRSFLRDDPILLHPRLMALKKKYVHVRGMSLRRNEPKNFTILRIEHYADPAKNDKWAEHLRRTFSSDVEFRREFKIDRSTHAGKPFYPAFAQYPKRYIARYNTRRLIHAPIIRGWDAGKRNPACCWLQFSRKSRRALVWNEIAGKDIDMYAFRDLVKYLSGQLSYESLSAHTTAAGTNRAYELLEELRLDKSYPDPPWYAGPGHSFVDVGGHEFIRPGPGLTKADEPQVAAEILALGDIYIQPPYSFKKSRYEIIRSLSKMRPDGKPGILLDPACPVLIRGLCGEIVYAKGTEAKPEPSDPAPNFYSHLHDALGYALVNTVALEHAEYFATTADGELQIPDLDEEETQIVESYLTGE